MKRYARVAGNGIAPLVDRVRAAGLATTDLSATLWNAAWSRGCDDITVLVPEPGYRIEGFAIFARETFPGEHILLIDAGGVIWGFVAVGSAPPAGARIRVCAGLTIGGGCWNVAVTERLGAGLTMRFDRTHETAQSGWIDAARRTLEAIAHAEVQRRLSIDAQRRALPLAEPVASMPDDLRARHAALIARVDAETAPTLAERATLERASSPVRRALLAEITARRLARYRSELAAFQASVPAIVAEREARIAANVQVRVALQALEDDAARSRAIEQRTHVSQRQLDAIQAANLCVNGFDPARFAPDDQPSAADLINAIALLFALIPTPRAHPSTSSG